MAKVLSRKAIQQMISRQGSTSVTIQGSGSGGGGSTPSVSLGPLLTSLNAEAMPSAEGYLHWTGSAWEWTTPTSGDPVDLTPYAQISWVELNYATLNDISGLLTKSEADGYYAPISFVKPYLPLAAGSSYPLTGSLYINGNNNGIQWSKNKGMLCYKPSSGWSGVTSNQWGVGSQDADGIIRSGSALERFDGTNNYTIYDSSNLNPLNYLRKDGGTVAGTLNVKTLLNVQSSEGANKVTIDGSTANIEIASGGQITFDTDSYIFHDATNDCLAIYGNNGLLIQTDTYVGSVASGNQVATRNWVTQRGYATTQDLSYALSGKVSKDGDTMTGSLTMVGNSILLKRTASGNIDGAITTGTVTPPNYQNAVGCITIGGTVNFDNDGAPPLVSGKWIATQEWVQNQYSSLFTQFANYDGSVLITVGGTQKSLVIGYASSAGSANTAVNADKLDNAHGSEFYSLSVHNTTAIVTGDDLNSYTTAGTFTTTGGNLGSSVASSLLNKPEFGGGFRMYVTALDPTSAYIHQRILTYSGRVFDRFSAAVTGSTPWPNDWKELSYKSDLSNYLPLTGGTLTGGLTLHYNNEYGGIGIGSNGRLQVLGNGVEILSDTLVWYNGNEIATVADLTSYVPKTWKPALLSPSSVGGAVGISSGADLNEFETSGTYYCESAAIAGSLSNTPYTGGNFRLFVIVNTGTEGLGNSWWGTQILFTGNALNGIYTRGHSNTSWTSWRRANPIIRNTKDNNAEVTTVDTLYLPLTVGTGSAAGNVELNLSDYALAANYLPLTAGSSKPLTGDLWVNAVGNNEKSIFVKTNRKKANGSGWAFTLLGAAGANSSVFFNIGAYGLNDDMNYAYIGANNYNSTENLRVYPDGSICVNGSIKYQGTKAIYSMIKFIDNTADTNGNGIAIGGGGATIIGGGESSSTMLEGLTKGSDNLPYGGNERMFIGNNSDVSIFTNLQSNWASRKEFLFGSDGSLTLSNPGYVCFKDNGGTSHIGIGINSNNSFMLGYGSSRWGLASYIDGSPLIFRTSTSDGTSGVNSTERMRITKDGNVGIGTSPAYKLDVNGNVGITGGLNIKNGGLVIVDSQAVHDFTAFWTTYNDAEWMAMYAHETKYWNLCLGTHPNGIGNGGLCMYNAGNNDLRWGIGTITPEYKLDVRDVVRSTVGFVVRPTSGNYVGLNNEGLTFMGASASSAVQLMDFGYDSTNNIATVKFHVRPQVKTGTNTYTDVALTSDLSAYVPLSGNSTINGSLTATSYVKVGSNGFLFGNALHDSHIKQIAEQYSSDTTQVIEYMVDAGGRHFFRTMNSSGTQKTLAAIHADSLNFEASLSGASIYLSGGHVYARNSNGQSQMII